MDDPARDLREFIAGYYYGAVSEETVAADAKALIDWMSDRGWQFTNKYPDAEGA